MARTSRGVEHRTRCGMNFISIFVLYRINFCIQKILSHFGQKYEDKQMRSNLHSSSYKKCAKKLTEEYIMVGCLVSQLKHGHSLLKFVLNIGQ